ALGGWAAERFTEVSILEPGQVLHQAEQVRAGRCHRSATIVFTQVVELGQQRGPGGLELAVQLLFQVRHGTSKTWSGWPDLNRRPLRPERWRGPRSGSTTSPLSSILAWLAGFEDSTCAVIAGLITRARAAGHLSPSDRAQRPGRGRLCQAGCRRRVRRLR